MQKHKKSKRAGIANYFLKFKEFFKAHIKMGMIIITRNEFLVNAEKKSLHTY